VGAAAESPRGGCERPRRGMAFLTPSGELLPVRCKSPNKCSYCAFLSAAEDGMMVLQDALRGPAPNVSLTVTTVNAHTEPAHFRRDVEQLFRGLRRRCPDAEYLGRIEFTTGKGRNSGGHRRIHQHTLVKGVSVDQVAELEDDLRSIWRSRTGAHRIELAELRSAAGAAHYLTTHHSKASQAPAKGWVGRRLRASRGYFDLPAPQRREEARTALRDRRAERRFFELLDEQDLSPYDLGPDWDEVLADELERVRLEAECTRLVYVQRVPTDFGPDGLPITWIDEVAGPVHDVGG
jgi:hypothetical protein